VGEGSTGEEKLESTGVELLIEGDSVIVDGVSFDSPAEAAGMDFDQVIQSVSVPKRSLPKELMYIPALLLLGLIWKFQQGRREKLPPVSAPPTGPATDPANNPTTTAA